MAEIQIKCQGSGHMPLDELLPMQGKLKSLSDENFAKLHDLIITKGFDSPIQVWPSSDGKLYILDGHQRRLVLLKLREEGYTIPNIPVDTINAENYHDAKERLLTKVSVYGHVNEDGLDEFINEPDAIIEPDFGELLDIPGIDFDKADEIVDGGRGSHDPQPIIITCPNCQHEFDPKA